MTMCYPSCVLMMPDCKSTCMKGMNSTSCLCVSLSLMVLLTLTAKQGAKLMGFCVFLRKIPSPK